MQIQSISAQKNEHIFDASSTPSSVSSLTSSPSVFSSSSSSSSCVPSHHLQIVSLGAGSDTNYFKLKASGLAPFLCEFIFNY